MHKMVMRVVGSLGVLALLSGTVVVGGGAMASAGLKATPKPEVAAKVVATTKPRSAVVSKPAAPAPTPSPAKVHVVELGDSLSSIAEAEHLESWRPLWDANAEVADPDLIYAGQQLTVPAGPTTPRLLPERPAAVMPQTKVPAESRGAARRPAGPANYAAGAGGVLERIRMRESGGNYATNTGNGYYGAYQFSLGTWQGVGGSGLPSEASPAEQDLRAQMLYDRRGCNPWPNTCY